MQTWNLINFLLGARCVSVKPKRNQNPARKSFLVKKLDRPKKFSVCWCKCVLSFFFFEFSSNSMGNGQQPQFECNLVSNLKCSSRMKDAKMPAHVWPCPLWECWKVFAFAAAWPLPSAARKLHAPTHLEASVWVQTHIHKPRHSMFTVLVLALTYPQLAAGHARWLWAPWRPGTRRTRHPGPAHTWSAGSSTCPAALWPGIAGRLWRQPCKWRTKWH